MSDGGKSEFYRFPDWVHDPDSLARYLQLIPPEKDQLKTFFSRIGERHSGTDPKREARKNLHYAIERMRWDGFTDEEIREQIEKQILL